MSSTYQILCVGHDPAIPLDLAEYPTSDAALAALRDPSARTDRDRQTLHLHADCDLLISRHSGAPVEITCPGTPVCRDRHRDLVTIETAWLRLAYAALQHPDILAAAGRLPGCWTHHRIRALRYEIGAVHYPDPDQPDPAREGDR